MHRAAAQVALLLALALASAAIGCGRAQSEKAMEHVQEANSHLAAAAEAIKGLSDFQKNWEAMTGSNQADVVAAAEKLETMLIAAQASEQKALSELDDAEAALRRAGEEKISADMKSYLKMKLDAVAEQKKGLAEELKAMLLRLDVARAVAQGATVDQLLGLQKSVEELEDSAREYMMKAGAMHQDANDYYDEKKLGK